MASCYLYQRILKLAQTLYGSDDYHEFPHIVLISFPFFRADPEKIQKDLSTCLMRLKNSGADILALACNSFHGYLPDTTGYDFVHLIDASVKRAQALKLSKILILSAPKTIEMKLYEREGLTCIYPHKDDQSAINLIIREISSGKVSIDQNIRLQQVIEQAGAIDGVFLACTELPLVHEAFPLSNHLPIVDTVEVLAKELIDRVKTN